MASSKEYISAIAREVGEWPGASVEFALSARHQIAELRFCGRRVRHYFPSTPSDARGLANCLSDIRRALKSIGAWRAKARPSPHRNRTRNKPERGFPVDLGPAPIMADPFKGLAILKEKLPMTREITIEGRTVVLETGKAPPPITVGRDKGPIRLLCEAMKDNESAYIPLPPKAVQSANLHGIGKALGARFSYRQEAEGIRIYRLPAKTVAPVAQANVEPIKAAAGW